MLTFSDTDPKINPAQEEALRTDSSLSSDMVTEVTMTLSISSIMEMPAKRQRTENPDLASICQVKIVARGNMIFVCFGSSNFRAIVYLVDVRSVIDPNTVIGYLAVQGESAASGRANQSQSASRNIDWNAVISSEK